VTGADEKWIEKNPEKGVQAEIRMEWSLSGAFRKHAQ